MHVHIPCLIINYQKSLFCLFGRHFPVRTNPVIPVFQQSFGFPDHHLGKTLFHEARPVDVLLEIIPEPVILEERNVILMRVRHLKHGGLKTIYQQSPPLVTLAEINGTFHRIHPPFLQPLPATIKQHERSFLIINTLEEPHAPHRVRIQPTSILVDKRSHTPNACSFFIPK